MPKRIRYHPAYASGARVKRGDTFHIGVESLAILGWDAKSRTPYVILRDARGDLKIANSYELGEAGISWRVTTS